MNSAFGATGVDGQIGLQLPHTPYNAAVRFLSAEGAVSSTSLGQRPRGDGKKRHER